MKKRIYLANKPNTERARIDSKIYDKLGADFLIAHPSCSLRSLEYLSQKNKILAPKYEYEILNEMRGRGYKLHHQHPILFRYLPDFIHFATNDNVIIEIDGPSHEGRRFQDRERTMLLELFRFEVMRFDAPRKSTDYDKICNQIEKRLKPHRVSGLKRIIRPKSGEYPATKEDPSFQKQLEFVKQIKSKK